MFLSKFIEGGDDIVVEYKVVLLLVGRILSRLSGAPTPFDFENVELLFTLGRVMAVEKFQ
ncbi:hypothetical protein D3C77_717270 [compost metagenome]